MTERQGFADGNASLRALKARKIARLLGLEPDSQGRLLEVGTGSGEIAAALARESPRLQVHATDIRDNRSTRSGYRFHLTQGTALPFPEAYFDFVVSNHVIEHVGERTEQIAHLRELRRVAGPGGRGYLAMPSRWQLVEPHYGVAFLSWLPRALRSPYLRFRRAGDWYDCEPMGHAALQRLVRAAGFEARNESLRAASLFFQIEKPGSPGARLLHERALPWLRPLRSLLPTVVLLMRPRPGG